MTTIFSESVYEPKDKWNVYHYCDDIFCVIKYPKDKSINQMREFLFYKSALECPPLKKDGQPNKREISVLFSQEKNRLKQTERN